MSGQHSQGTPSRIQKSSPNIGKQGPLKATIPISSVLKQGIHLKSSSASTVSPTYLWKNRTSPDQYSGQRSPGSSTYKGKSKTLESSSSESSSIRRTASLDTIYLKGHWPRDMCYWHTGTLQLDKATQTDDSDWTEAKKSQCILGTEDKIEKIMIRSKLRGTREPNGRHGSPGENTLNSSCQTLSTYILSPTFKANPVNIPMKPLPKASIRSSVEGLNQEIERIVLKSDSELHCSRNDEYDKCFQVTPEGHRAPLAELFRNTRSRSVNTQTPQDFGSSSHSSGDSQGSSPDQETSKLGSSPHINKFLAREPPDGCEKVHSKSLEERKCVPLELVPQPCTFKLKPSLGSAFQILHPYINTLDQDLPLVPSQQENN